MHQLATAKSDHCKTVALTMSTMSNMALDTARCGDETMSATSQEHTTYARVPLQASTYSAVSVRPTGISSERAQLQCASGHCRRVCYAAGGRNNEKYAASSPASRLEPPLAAAACPPLPPLPLLVPPSCSRAVRTLSLTSKLLSDCKHTHIHGSRVNGRREVEAKS